MQEKAKILAILARYNDAFAASKPLSENALEVYVEALEDLPAEVVAAAMKKLVLTARFFPTVAEIREAAEGLVRHSNGTELLSAEEAWAEAMKLNRSYGPQEEWPFSCEEVREAVRRFGGKLELALVTDEGLNTARAQFRRCYESVIDGARDKRANDAVLGDNNAALPPAVRAMIERMGA